jgi:radical SAM superfamily enzyme YgiQ (UPF0313 family)
MRFLFVVKSKAIETLGPMHLAAIAKRFGHEARIIDIENAPIMTSEWKPDVIGYSVLTGSQLSFLHLNERLRQIAPDATVVVGGPHPTFFPRDFPVGKFDFVVRGEAENWMLSFIGQGGSFGELDDIPFPDRSSFPDMKIRDFIATRGCPFSCRYCFNEKWHALYPSLRKVRTRSVENVISEIESVRPEFVYFQDSCFGVNIDWLRVFSEDYKDRIDIPFHCHLRPSQVTPERVSLLKASNCLSTRIALETASDKLRKVIGREQTSNEETIRSATLLRKAGIRLMIQNMLALPTSTIEDDLHTLEVNIQCKPDYAWSSIFAPYPGTALGDECKEKGWYTGDYADLTDSFFDKSVLNFSEEYKEQTYLLQKVFALAVEAQCMPEIGELTQSNIFTFIHRAMRKLGDGKLYGGII